MTNRKQHRPDLDFIRIMAILAVVAIHVATPVLLHNDPNSVGWNLVNLITSYTRWAVPVFVMISGAVVIKKSAYLNTADFFRRRAKRLLAPIIAWPILYAIWGYYIYPNAGMNVDSFMYGYLLGVPIAGYHLYFLFLIAGLYLLTPIISAFVSVVSRKYIIGTTVSILAITAAWFHLDSFLPGDGAQLNMLTQGLPYVGYFMLGYLIKDIKLTNCWLPLIASVVGLAAITVASYFTYVNTGDFMFHRSPSILQILVAPAVFVSLQWLYYAISRKYQAVDKLAANLSPTIFGIYLIHLMIMVSLVKLFSIDDSKIANVPMVFVATVVLSLVATRLLATIPKVKLLLG